eukprot:6204629-Alexandrium_andersonii.AAC.1
MKHDAKARKETRRSARWFGARRICKQCLACGSHANSPLHMSYADWRPCAAWRETQMSDAEFRHAQAPELP